MDPTPRVATIVSLYHPVAAPGKAGLTGRLPLATTGQAFSLRPPAAIATISLIDEPNGLSQSRLANGYESRFMEVHYAQKLTASRTG